MAKTSKYEWWKIEMSKSVQRMDYQEAHEAGLFLERNSPLLNVEQGVGSSSTMLTMHVDPECRGLFENHLEICVETSLARLLHVVKRNDHEHIVAQEGDRHQNVLEPHGYVRPSVKFVSKVIYVHTHNELITYLNGMKQP